MKDVLLQLGVGGIFAILILERVFNFIKEFKKPKEQDHGIYGVHAEILLAMNTALSNRVLPLIEEIKDNQRTDLEVLREKFHDVNNLLNEFNLQLRLIRQKVLGTQS